jgi:hypothetical protein
VQEVAAAMPKLAWQDIARDAAENWKSRGQTMPTDGLKPLGVLDSDQDAIYFGIIMASQGLDGRITTVAGVVGVTLVNKVMLSINLYRVYAGQGTIDALLKEQRQNVRALIQANDAPPRGADSNTLAVSGIDWREIAISAAIGGAIFAGLLCLFAVFQRVRDAINS